jgi:formylglycine-generating enzyme required for sulfatase activity
VLVLGVQPFACGTSNLDDGSQLGDDAGQSEETGDATTAPPHMRSDASADGAMDAPVATQDAGAEEMAPPSPTDGIKNGSETDVDCGGLGNPQCGVGKGCLTHGDCASDGCGYDGKCVSRRSCTGHFGGDTCGMGGAGSIGPASWESCCATAPSAGVQLDKYQVTAGRMRAFITRVAGNVRAFVQAKRASGLPQGVTFPASYDLYLPNAMDGCDQTGTCGPAELSDHFYDEPNSGNPPYDSFQGIYTSVYRQLGGNIFNGQDLPRQGCQISSYGTHSYWMPPNKKLQYFGDLPAEQSQDIYDTKPLNCVNYLMAQAFCLWDGGRLETVAEWVAAWGPDRFPWGPTPGPLGIGSDTYYANRFPTATDVTHPPPGGFSIEWGNYYFSYEYPNLVNQDYIVFLNAPGRLRGRGPNGHADVIGNLMEATSDVTLDTGDPRTSKMSWTTNGSFEGHSWQNSSIFNMSLITKYGMQGLRCAYP